MINIRIGPGATERTINREEEAREPRQEQRKGGAQRASGDALRSSFFIGEGTETKLKTVERSEHRRKKSHDKHGTPERESIIARRDKIHQEKDSLANRRTKRNREKEREREREREGEERGPRVERQR